MILVGEMRDFETISIALTAAETGHLVLSTLHTVDTTETINRIISVFPPYQQKQVRMQLAAVLKGIVSQRLIARADGKGRVPAVEVMLGTLSVREAVIDEAKDAPDPDDHPQGMVHYGMQTFDQSLLGLYKKGLITYEEALLSASNPDDFALKVKGVSVDERHGCGRGRETKIRHRPPGDHRRERRGGLCPKAKEAQEYKDRQATASSRSTGSGISRADRGGHGDRETRGNGVETPAR